MGLRKDNAGAAVQANDAMHSRRAITLETGKSNKRKGQDNHFIQLGGGGQSESQDGKRLKQDLKRSKNASADLPSLNLPGLMGAAGNAQHSSLPVVASKFGGGGSSCRGQSMTLDDIRSRATGLISSLERAVEAGLKEDLGSLLGEAIEAKAKEHMELVSAGLKHSQDLQKQVKGHHERALEDVQRAVGEAGTVLMGQDREMGQQLKNVFASAREEIRTVQGKYMRV